MQKANGKRARCRNYPVKMRLQRFADYLVKLMDGARSRRQSNERDELGIDSVDRVLENVDVLDGCLCKIDGC